MKCKVIQLRNNGIAVPRHSIRAQYPIEGDLEILDMRDEGVSRVIKTARLLVSEWRVRGGALRSSHSLDE